MNKSIDFTGEWENTKASILNIVQSGSDIKGTFQSKVGKPPADHKSDVVGYANEDSISIIVNFHPYGLQTAFSGVITSLGTQLQLVMQWHLLRDQTDDPDTGKPLGAWQRILTGGDTFTKK